MEGYNATVFAYGQTVSTPIYKLCISCYLKRTRLLVINQLVVVGEAGGEGEGHLHVSATRAVGGIITEATSMLAGGCSPCRATQAIQVGMTRLSAIHWPSVQVGGCEQG